MTIAASAISGIINRAGFKKADTRTDAWSRGFSVEGFANFVRVWFADKDTNVADEKLAEIAALINNRPDKKYFAKVINIGDNSVRVVEVVAYDATDPDQNEARKAEAQEKLAADHPAAPAIADVKKALRRYSQYDADFYDSGYKVERWEEDSRLVRVRLVEGPYAAYPEISRDAWIDQTLQNYARMIHEAGFEFRIFADEMSVLVATVGEWNNRLTPETVGVLLRARFATSLIRSYTRGTDVLRVEYYAPTDGQEAQMHHVLDRYARYLMEYGYEVTLEPEHPWTFVVKLPAAPMGPEVADDGDDPQKVREALLALREAVEDDSLLYTTRRAGPWSIFVMRDGRRLEVAYGNGEYRSQGYMGRGRTFRFSTADKSLLNFIRSELLG